MLRAYSFCYNGLYAARGEDDKGWLGGDEDHDGFSNVASGQKSRMKLIPIVRTGAARSASSCYNYALFFIFFFLVIAVNTRLYLARL